MSDLELNHAGWPTRDLFDAIGEQAVTAAGVSVEDRVAIKEISGRPEIVLIVDKNGDYKEMPKSQPARRHSLLSCHDVVSYCQFSLENNAKPIVWIGEKSIIVTDDADRLRGDCATYATATTELFQKISGLGKGNGGDGYSQADFLSLLRVHFARAFQSDGVRTDLIRTVRKLQRQERSNVLQGSGSYEANMVSEANEAVDWPDSLQLQTTVFEDPGLPDVWPVEVVLDVRPENKAKPFVLTAVGADLTKAVQSAMQLAADTIRNQLESLQVPIFLGTPQRSN